MKQKTIMIRPHLTQKRRGESLIVDFWAILVFVVILLIIFILFWLNKEQATNKVSEDFKNKDGAFILNSFLRAPYLSNGQEMGLSMSEVIAQDVYTDNFTRTERAFFYYMSGIHQYTGYMQKEYYMHRNITAMRLCIYDADDDLSRVITYNVADSSSLVTLQFICDINTFPVRSQTKIPGIDGTYIVHLGIKYSNVDVK